MTREICASHIYIPILLFFIIIPIYSGVEEIKILQSHDYNFDCDNYYKPLFSKVPDTYKAGWDKWDCKDTERAVDWKLGLGTATLLLLFYERNDKHKWFKIKDCNK